MRKLVLAVFIFSAAVISSFAQQNNSAQDVSKDSKYQASVPEPKPQTPPVASNSGQAEDSRIITRQGPPKGAIIIGNKPMDLRKLISEAQKRRVMYMPAEEKAEDKTHPSAHPDFPSAAKESSGEQPEPPETFRPDRESVSDLK